MGEILKNTENVNSKTLNKKLSSHDSKLIGMPKSHRI